MMRGVLTLACALLLAGCLGEAKARRGERMTTGQALARHACPHRIAEASAWVNHMPSVGRVPRNLVVDVELAEKSDTAVLLKSPASTDKTLVLEIRSAPAAPTPGRLAYREPARDPMYERISFVCRGAEIRSLEQIEKVY